MYLVKATAVSFSIWSTQHYTRYQLRKIRRRVAKELAIEPANHQ